ncbi:MULTISPECIES: hypothetical protein [unclassified Bacillus (in: firmicutes)]|nr:MULTISPECIES: hypothetical protein [unclassified Bacillus (in: firmicutes)]
MNIKRIEKVALDSFSAKDMDCFEQSIILKEVMKVEEAVKQVIKGSFS